MNNERPSVYLTEKCEALEKVLDWIIVGQHHKGINDKLLSFLSQIDFWDWEMENLLFSFDNFAERSKAWADQAGIQDFLKSKFGMMVKAPFSDQIDLVYKREWRKYNEKEVVAPFEKLNLIIDKWNSVLGVCEDRLFIAEKTAEQYVSLGAQILPNLDKYRKAKVNNV
jgi:hypothetical protein